MILPLSNRKGFLLFASICVFFILVHIVAIHHPYHQDEYKWVSYSHNASGAVPHPPLTEFIYLKLGPIVGDNNFRLIPSAFGLVNLFLIFYLTKIIFDKRSAFWVAGLFTVSFYSILASLMVDVDGAVMPFFFLIMCIGYFKLTSSPAHLLCRDRWEEDKSLKYFLIWGGIMLFGAIGGFMIKVSGILPIGALFLDFLIKKSVFSDKKRILKYLSLGLLGVLILIGLLLFAKFVFPFFNLQYSLKYWKHFANSSSFLSRGWLQTFIQLAKSMLYLSPLLVLPAFLTDREIWKKARPFFFFIFIGLVFYLFAFDFSLGALDRYFQFLIIPLCLIGGAVIAKNIKFSYQRSVIEIVSLIMLAIAIFSVQFFKHSTPSLYPKAEWLDRIFSFKWDFLYPFSGGSGPLPFYVSFSFIGIIWICSAIFAIAALIKRDFKKQSVIAILIFGLFYNAVFAEEYLFGKINGSAKRLVADSAEFIKDSHEIKKVIVYNDNGGWIIQKAGKYERRMYATPQFESEYRKILKNFSGHVLFINIPKLQEPSFYSDYMNSCRVVYGKTDNYIESKILDCRK